MIYGLLAIAALALAALLHTLARIMTRVIGGQLRAVKGLKRLAAWLEAYGFRSRKGRG